MQSGFHGYVQAGTLHPCTNGVNSAGHRNPDVTQDLAVRRSAAYMHGLYYQHVLSANLQPGSPGLNQPIFLRSLRVFVLAGVVMAAPAALAAQQKHGDVNGDGVVGALDAQAILTSVVGSALPPGFVAANGDANCDAVVNALDALVVLSFVIGRDVSMQCVGKSFGPSATRVTITPSDTSLLIDRGMWLRATLRDSGGFAIVRPVAWSVSHPDIVVIDTARTRGDSTYVLAKSNAGTATISAFSDGSSAATPMKVVTSYAGIVIVPQRPDTLRQLNAPYAFSVRMRDSVGTFTTFPTAIWSVLDTNIATVTSAISGSATVTTKTNGVTYLLAVSSTSATVKDSVRLVVALAPQSSCTGVGGTLHPTTTYAAPQSWLASGNPHYVTGTQTFNTGSRLTIGPGALLCISSGVQLTFNAGSRLIARGKPDSLITFTGATSTTSWSGIQLGNMFSYAATAPADTSWITNALLERGGSSQGISGREQHALVMDSVRLRQFVWTGVRLLGPGSRLSRSAIDTLTSTGTAAAVGRGMLEFSTIRSGSATSGVSLSDTGTVRNVTIVGGTTAITYTCCTDSARVNDVAISGTTGVALDIRLALRSGSANVQILGGTGGAFSGSIGNLGVLFPDSASQGTLKGNGKDTVFIRGGTVRRATVVVRPDLPWVVQQTPIIDTLAVLVPRPGAQLLFTHSRLTFRSGGRLEAVGEAAKFIRFGPQHGHFHGLLFDNPGAGADLSLAPTAASSMSFVQLDSASGTNTPSGGFWWPAAITAGDRHRVVIDSAIVRKSWNGAVALAAPGSQLKRSLIDTTGQVSTTFTANYPAVALGRKTLAQNVLVRRSGHVGVYVQAGAADTTAKLTNVRIVASKRAGLEVASGILEGDLGSVRIDSANFYPFRGHISNLARIANDSVTQNNLVGNTNDVVEFTGGSISTTLTLSPRLRWHTVSQVIIDTLGVLTPRPGTDLTFSYGYFRFQHGGTLNAVGTPAKFIRFRPGTFDGSSPYFHGLEFDNPGQGPNPGITPPRGDEHAEPRPNGFGRGRMDARRRDMGLRCHQCREPPQDHHRQPRRAAGAPRRGVSGRARK